VRRPAVGLSLALAGLVLVAVVALVVTRDRPGPPAPPSPTPSAGSPAPSSELAGEWSGEGVVSRCAGLGGEVCSATRSFTLTIDCDRKPCVVTPFDRSYGSPALRFADGGYAAVGPLPAAAAPTCGGVPTTSGRWELGFRLQPGRLTGTYEESTIQGFDCGGTGVAWTITLERS
jgi:hypothetical protein